MRLVQLQPGRGALARNQRSNYNNPLFALDDCHIRQVVSFNLADSRTNFVQLVLGVELALAPEVRVRRAGHSSAIKSHALKSQTMRRRVSSISERGGMIGASWRLFWEGAESIYQIRALRDGMARYPPVASGSTVPVHQPSALSVSAFSPNQYIALHSWHIAEPGSLRHGWVSITYLDLYGVRQ
ncbi:hypothetical protein BDW60DRAFT_211677 [Aspergillus nidulans var. acristatus]